MFNRKQGVGIAIAVTVLIFVFGAEAIWQQAKEVKQTMESTNPPLNQSSVHDLSKCPSSPTSTSTAMMMNRLGTGDICVLKDYADWLSANGTVKEVPGGYFLAFIYTYTTEEGTYHSHQTIAVSDGKVNLIKDGFYVSQPLRFFKNQAFYYCGPGDLWVPSYCMEDIKGNITKVVEFIGKVNPNPKPGQSSGSTNEFFYPFEIALGEWKLRRPFVDQDATFKNPPLVFIQSFNPDLEKDSYSVSPENAVSDELLASVFTLRPGAPHFDSKTVSELSCLDRWDNLYAQITKGDAKNIADFEGCAQILKYPMATFTSENKEVHIGFLGNTNVRPEPTGDGTKTALPVCNAAGVSWNNCYVYQMKNGQLVFIDDASKTREMGDMILIKFVSDHEALVDKSYDRYFGIYDFAQQATTQKLLTIDENGITFDTGTKKITIGIKGNLGHNSGTETLTYKGKSIGGFIAPSPFGYSEDIFPRQDDLISYFLQDDRSKFYFTSVSSSYVLDLASDPPKLIKQ